LLSGDCGECPGHINLEEILEIMFTDNAVENITFKQWVSTDRCELETIVKSVGELIESLHENKFFHLHGPLHYTNIHLCHICAFLSQHFWQKLVLALQQDVRTLQPVKRSN
jgi:tRNA A-37 threonylcarbamoyl transferase component Bud32